MMRNGIRNFIIVTGLAVCLLFGSHISIGGVAFAMHQSFFYGIVEKVDPKAITVGPFIESEGVVKGKSIKLLLDKRDDVSGFETGERIIVHYMPPALEEKERIKELHVRLGSQVSKMDSVQCKIAEKPKHGKIKVKLTEQKDGLKKGEAVTLLCKEADDCKDIYSKVFKKGKKLKVYYFVKLNVNKTVWIGSVEKQVIRE